MLDLIDLQKSDILGAAKTAVTQNEPQFFERCCRLWKQTNPDDKGNMLMAIACSSENYRLIKIYLKDFEKPIDVHFFINILPAFLRPICSDLLTRTQPSAHAELQLKMLSLMENLRANAEKFLENYINQNTIETTSIKGLFKSMVYSPKIQEVEEAKTCQKRLKSCYKVEQVMKVLNELSQSASADLQKNFSEALKKIVDSELSGIKSPIKKL